MAIPIRRMVRRNLAPAVSSFAVFLFVLAVIGRPAPTAVDTGNNYNDAADRPAKVRMVTRDEA